LSLFGQWFDILVAAAACLAWYFKPSFLSRDDGFLFCADGFLLSQE